jgi:UDP-4-amino-4,6-dideoxy-N-acetyl-beta-L-altrosamine N-acetyltransferase
MHIDPSQASEGPITQVCRLVMITTLDTGAQLAIRDIRNQKSVRDAMFSDHFIGVNEHLQWISSLRRNPHVLAFALESTPAHPLGVISLKDWERVHGTASWGYYVSELSRGAGLGTAMTYSFLDFIFDVLHLEKLNAEVIEENQLSIKQHQNLGFEIEGFRRSNVMKHDVRLGVYLFGMSKANWNRKRSAVSTRYRRVLDAIPVTIHWNADEANPTAVDLIEQARARNNLNWMSILRIALEQSPATAKQIVAEIRKIDLEISGLTQEITGDIDTDSNS